MKLLDRKTYLAQQAKDKSGKCSFCNLKKQIVIKDFGNWVWVMNIAPYQKFHTLLIPKEHREKFWDLNRDEYHDLSWVYNIVIKQYIKALPDQKRSIFLLRDFWQLDSRHPEHLHIHIMPDHQNMLDGIQDPEASKIDVKEFIKKVQ